MLRLAMPAAAFAAAELAAALLIGRFFAWGRAEALLFFAFRPWLCLLLALWVARRGWSFRLSTYLLALTLAALSETLFLIALGAPDPAPDMLRGFVGGSLLLLVADGVLQFGRRLGDRAGSMGGSAILLALLLIPGGLRPYEAIILGKAPASAPGDQPGLMLLTGLPIIWGEGGAFDPASRPAAGYRMLQSEYRVRPLDTLDRTTLGQGRLLLVAQPRRLAPRELAALDGWVRGGGRALILTDPTLIWPSRLPLGDARRPPPVGLLGPLLDHWGLALDRDDEPGLVVRHLRLEGAGRRLVMAAPGRFVALGNACAVEAGGLIARCRLGEGEAMLVADADLLDDRLWAAPGARGDERHARIADNPLIVADWLDGLIGRDRPRIGGTVAWLPADTTGGRRRALLFAAAPILLLPLLAFVADRARSRRA